MPIIGFLAKRRRGKDTLADYLVSHHGFRKDSFANPLKEACRILFGFTDEQLYGNEKEKVDPRWGVEPRVVLQFVGTEIVRDQFHKILPDIGKDFWLKSFKLRYEEGLKKGIENVVIADVRFQNEVDLIHSLGGKVYKIVRPSLDEEDKKLSKDVEDKRMIDAFKELNKIAEKNGGELPPFPNLMKVSEDSIMKNSPPPESTMKRSSPSPIKLISMTCTLCHNDVLVECPICSNSESSSHPLTKLREMKCTLCHNTVLVDCPICSTPDCGCFSDTSKTITVDEDMEDDLPDLIQLAELKCGVCHQTSHVECPQCDGIAKEEKPLPTKQQFNQGHASENIDIIQNYDAIILNDRDLSHIYTQLDALIKK
jgi:hypothetical protein